MTQRTILASAGSMEANPIYQSLRDRFTDDNGYTVGQAMLQSAARDGYVCFPASRRTQSVERERDTRVEQQLTHANFLPREKAGKRSGGALALQSLSSRMVMIIALAACLMMVMLFTAMRVDQLNRDITALNREASALSEQQQSLNAKLEEKNDLREIEEIAQSELGMVKNTTVQHVYYPSADKDSVTVYGNDSSSAFIEGLLSVLGQ